jgi:monovalent cation/proton antiporter MnhG/PhaG subunit
MGKYHLIVQILLGIAVLSTLIVSFGILSFRDAYQRLHLSALITGIASPLIAIAYWLDSADFQARIKVLLIVFLLFFMNSVLTHATARAYRIWKTGHFEIKPQDEEKIERAA